MGMGVGGSWGNTASFFVLVSNLLIHKHKVLSYRVIVWLKIGKLNFRNIFSDHKGQGKFKSAIQK